MSFYMGYEQSYGSASQVYQFHPTSFIINESETFISPYFKHDLYLSYHNNIRSSMRKLVQFKFSINGLEIMMYILRSLLRFSSYVSNTHTFVPKNNSNTTTCTILTNQGYDIQKALITSLKMKFNKVSSLTNEVEGVGFYAQLNPTQNSRSIDTISNVSATFTLAGTTLSTQEIEIDISQTTSHNFILANTTTNNDLIVSHGKSHIAFSALCYMTLTQYDSFITNTSATTNLLIGDTSKGVRLTGTCIYSLDLEYITKSFVLVKVKGYMISTDTQVLLYSAYGMLP